jgi:hypothetical protein
MTKITQGSLIILVLACLIPLSSGCSHQQTVSSIPSTNTDSSAVENKFLNDVANLPMDQRQAYVSSNQATVQSLSHDGMAKLMGLLPPSNR